MRVLVINPNPSRRDDLTTELWEHGSTGILEEDASVRAYFPEDLDVSEIVSPENGTVVEWLHESETSPLPLNEANNEPVLLGRQFVVLTGVASSPTEAGRQLVSLPNSQAFGSGRHETTQLMVEVMEMHLQPGAVVVDIGCGSGILSEVAVQLGAATTVMCDTHPDAVSTSGQTSSRSFAFLGSADSIADSTADLVLANITPRIIDLLTPDLVRILKPGGILLLSGFLEDATPRWFQPEVICERNGWLCWVCRPDRSRRDLTEASAPVQPFEERWW